MSFQNIKFFGRKYNWIVSSFAVHGMIAFAFTGEILAALSAIVISLDHVWILKKYPRRPKNIIGNLIQSRAKDKRDFLHKIPILVISAVLFVFFGFFIFDKLIYLIFIGIFVHLIQDFIEDYLFFNDISGWNY